MGAILDVVLRGNKLVRDYLAASLVVCLAVFGGAQGVILMAESVQRQDDAQIRAVAKGEARTYVVSRSVLDDEVTTGSLAAKAAQTRLDPCALPPAR